VGGMRMAKASRKDISGMMRFMRLLDGLTEHEADSGKIGNIVKHQFPKRCRGYYRVICGSEMLIENCCDPALNYLDWKPEIKEMMKRADDRGCHWGYSDEGYYETECLHTFSFSHGKKQPEFEYCPYCGKVIRTDTEEGKND